MDSIGMVPSHITDTETSPLFRSHSLCSSTSAWGPDFSFRGATHHPDLGRVYSQQGAHSRSLGCVAGDRWALLGDDRDFPRLGLFPSTPSTQFCSPPASSDDFCKSLFGGQACGLQTLRGCRSLSSTSQPAFRQRQRAPRALSPALPGGASRRTREGRERQAASVFEELTADDGSGSVDRQTERRGKPPGSADPARGNATPNKWRAPDAVSEARRDKERSFEGRAEPRAPLSPQAFPKGVARRHASPECPSLAPASSRPSRGAAPRTSHSSASSASSTSSAVSASSPSASRRDPASCFAEPHEFCGLVKLARKAATEAASLARLSGETRRQREADVSLLWRQLERQALGEGLLPLEFLAPAELSLLLSWCARGGFFSPPLFLKVAEIAAPQLPLWPARDVQTLLLAAERFVAASAAREDKGADGDGSSRRGGGRSRQSDEHRHTRETELCRSSSNLAHSPPAVSASVSSPSSVSLSLCGKERDAPASVRVGRLLFTAGLQHLLSHLPAYRPRHLRNMFDVVIAHEALLAHDAFDALRGVPVAGAQNAGPAATSGVYTPEEKTQGSATSPAKECGRAKEEAAGRRELEAERTETLASARGQRDRRAEGLKPELEERLDAGTFAQWETHPTCVSSAGVSGETSRQSASSLRLPFRLANEVAARAHLLSPATLCETAFFFFTLASRSKSSLPLSHDASSPFRASPCSSLSSRSSSAPQDLSHSSPYPPSLSSSSPYVSSSPLSSSSLSSSLSDLAAEVAALVGHRLLRLSASAPRPLTGEGEAEKGREGAGLGDARTVLLSPAALLRLPAEDVARPRRKGRLSAEAFALPASLEPHRTASGSAGAARSRPDSLARDGELCSETAEELHPIDGETYAKAAHVFCRLADAAEKASEGGRQWKAEKLDETKHFWRGFLRSWLLPHLHAALAEHHSQARLLLQTHQRALPSSLDSPLSSLSVSAPGSSPTGLSASASSRPLPFSPTYLGMLANALTFCPFAAALNPPSSDASSLSPASASPDSSSLLALVWRELLSVPTLRVASQEFPLRPLALTAAAAARCGALREQERVGVFEEILDPVLRCLEREADAEGPARHAEKQAKKGKKAKNVSAAPGLPEKLLADAYAAVFANSPSSSAFFLTNPGLSRLFDLLCRRVESRLDDVPLDILVYTLRAFSSVYVGLGSLPQLHAPSRPSAPASRPAPSAVWPRGPGGASPVPAAWLSQLQDELVALFQRACNTRLRAAFLPSSASPHPLALGASRASAYGLSSDCVNAILAACTRFGKVPVDLVCAINKDLTGFAAIPTVPRPYASGSANPVTLFRDGHAQQVAWARRAVLPALAPEPVPLSHVLTALSALSRLPFGRRFSPQWDALEHTLVSYLAQPFPSSASPPSSSPSSSCGSHFSLYFSASVSSSISGASPLLSLGDFARVFQTYAFALREPPVALLAALPPVLGPQTAKFLEERGAERDATDGDQLAGADGKRGDAIEGMKEGFCSVHREAARDGARLTRNERSDDTETDSADAETREPHAREGRDEREANPTRPPGEPCAPEERQCRGPLRPGASGETSPSGSAEDSSAADGETTLEMVCMYTRKTLASLVRLDSHTRGVPRPTPGTRACGEGGEGGDGHGRQRVSETEYKLDEDAFWKLTEHTLDAFMRLVSLPFSSGHLPASGVRRAGLQGRVLTASASSASRVSRFRPVSPPVPSPVPPSPSAALSPPDDACSSFAAPAVSAFQADTRRLASAQWSLERVRNLWLPHGVNTLADAASCATLVLYPPVFFSALRWWRTLCALERAERAWEDAQPSQHPTDGSESGRGDRHEDVELTAKASAEARAEVTGRAVLEGDGERGNEARGEGEGGGKGAPLVVCQSPTNGQASSPSSSPKHSELATHPSSPSSSSLSACVESPAPSAPAGSAASSPPWISVASSPSTFRLREVDHVRTARFLCCIVTGSFDFLLPLDSALEQPRASRATADSFSCSLSSPSSSSSCSSQRVAQLLSLMEKEDVLLLEFLRVAAQAVRESETRRRKSSSEGENERWTDTPVTRRDASSFCGRGKGDAANSTCAFFEDGDSLCQMRRDHYADAREPGTSLTGEETERKPVPSLHFHDEKEEARNPPLKMQTSIVETVEEIALLGWEAERDFVIHQEVQSMLFTIDILLIPRKPSSGALL
ncbi:conserved hypothetical protein [Neospora caninum Liverpool]|uniref:Uncharacterized protein n=1 Tax=Neospora caninum (strain Liverpool) TaxID=572307 RepID=F0VLM5_NEOCL|nr:conserved hypothetical protein [Neospora caninum Liverpool]CBZ54153.1 conserved hypothetical protein [Neospora caninum Liverpool]CEL68853.1 TPA: hypothetical protein BN1204_045850 [Neospora caninum Liverpool]|eukprot:XP_003884184.1 conserved hypothetical protein [Neospora caninum Liverpool]